MGPISEDGISQMPPPPPLFSTLCAYFPWLKFFCQAYGLVNYFSEKNMLSPRFVYLLVRFPDRNQPNRLIRFAGMISDVYLPLRFFYPEIWQNRGVDVRFPSVIYLPCLVVTVFMEVVCSPGRGGTILSWTVMCRPIGCFCGGMFP